MSTAITTPSGLSTNQIGVNGIYQIQNGYPLSASLLNDTLSDLQAENSYSQLAGVLYGGVCTALGLSVTVPGGTIYYATGVFVVTGTGAEINVANSSNSAIWGCSDGKLRATTATNVLPSGFDNMTCCLLTYAIAIAGSVTLENNQQESSRNVNGRIVTDGPLQLDYLNMIVDASDADLTAVPSYTGSNPTFPNNSKFYCWYRSDFGTFFIGNGTTSAPLQSIISVVTSDPGSPVKGQIWLNTVSGDLKMYDGTTVQTLVTGV